MTAARVALAVSLLAASCAVAPPPPPAPAPSAAIEAPAVPKRPQDDMFRAVNGEWLATVQIPADRSSWGALPELREQAVDQVGALVEEAARAGGKATPDQRRIADLHASFMDEARIEAAGTKPIEPLLENVDALRSTRDLPRLIAQFNALGITVPYVTYINQDPRDPKRTIAFIAQSGLGMPDRDYYLNETDAKLRDARTRYGAHVAALLSLAGFPNADADASQVLALETRLARDQWTRVESRDPVRTYNRVRVGDLDALTPGYRWAPWLDAARLAGRTPAVVVTQPSYLQGMAKTVDAVPLDTWKAYFRFHAIGAYAPYLSRAFADESFAFRERVLTGTPEIAPRWKRSVALIEASTGFALGRLYVARHFPPGHKARVDAMVKNILAAYRQSIEQIDWMGPATKKQAQAKLAKFDPKIGYPSRWRDYTGLVIRADDLVGNVMRARRFETARNRAKLGQPIDRTEWFMTPQTVNAYYNGLKNEIVFPAAILQAPIFDAAADDATNYGAIGAIIGHEISHGFDDRGSQFDGDGRLRDWWTVEDRKRFDAKTRVLIKQYDAFEPVPGYHVNGALTLGENIADNAGLAIAFKGWRLSQKGRPAPVVDGRSGDVRFYTGFARAWRSKVREPQMIALIKSDSHSPAEIRVNGTLRNQTPFHEAFGVQPGDGMYLSPEQRVTIW